MQGLNYAGYPDQIFFFNGSRGYGSLLADTNFAVSAPAGISPADLLVLVAFAGKPGMVLDAALAWDNQTQDLGGIQNSATLPSFFSESHARIALRKLQETGDAQLSYAMFGGDASGMKAGKFNVDFSVIRTAPSAQVSGYVASSWQYRLTQGGASVGWTEALAFYKAGASAGNWSVHFSQNGKTIQEAGKHFEELGAETPLLLLMHDAFPGFNEVQPLGSPITGFNLDFDSTAEAGAFAAMYVVHTNINIESATGLSASALHEVVGGPLPV